MDNVLDNKGHKYILTMMILFDLIVVLIIQVKVKDLNFRFYSIDFSQFSFKELIVLNCRASPRGKPTKRTCFGAEDIFFEVE